jgi:hypothetical protein
MIWIRFLSITVGDTGDPATTTIAAHPEWTRNPIAVPMCTHDVTSVEKKAAR